MENEKNIENVQEELKYKIITLEEDVEDSKIKKVINDITEELNETFEKFKTWYENNKDSEKIINFSKTIFIKKQFTN